MYRGFLQDSGRARRWRRRFASLAISPFSSSLPYRRVFLRCSFLTSPASRLYGPMRIPCWSFQTRCGTVIKDKSYLKDVRSNVCNDCNALTRSRYLKPSIIPCYVSDFQITSWFIYEPLQIRNTLLSGLMFAFLFLRAGSSASIPGIANLPYFSSILERKNCWRDSARLGHFVQLYSFTLNLPWLQSLFLNFSLNFIAFVTRPCHSSLNLLRIELIITFFFKYCSFHGLATGHWPVVIGLASNSR